MSAGSITTSAVDIGGFETRYTIAWVSDASGAVSGLTIDLTHGSLTRLSFVPDGGGTQPSDQYDVTLLDANNIDILNGSGANLSNSAGIAFELETSIPAGTYTLAVANAGNAKGGTIILLVGPAGAGALQSESLPVGASTASKQDSQITQETAINTVLGVKGDAKSAATDTTAITAMSVWKQISASVQAIATAIAATLTTQMAGWSFSNITTSTTTVVKSGAGVLHIINVNSKGTVASSIVAYDNTAGSGTKIATVDSLTLSGPFQYDLSFATGLTLVTTGTVAPDITVSYR